MNTNKEKFYVTKEGLKELKKECEILKKIRLDKAHEEAPSILESADLNPEYLSFKEDIELLEARLSDLEEIIKNAILIEKPKGEDVEFVNLGARIVVESEDEKDEFTIVGTVEANPTSGKISNESPVGKALMGHKIGDKITVFSPKRSVYKITQIKYN